MLPVFDPDDVGSGLAEFVTCAPSPFHACALAAAQLREAGYRAIDEADPFPTEPGRYLVVRGGSLVAWDSRRATSPGERGSGFRVVAAHTDSPNLRVKPRPDHSRAGWHLLGVEPYGGLIRASWLDRDLGLSGRVSVREGAAVGVATFLDDRPLLRVAHLAVHLDRGVNDGLTLDPQRDLVPLWSAAGTPPDFRSYLATRIERPARDILAWDVMLHDVAGAARTGLDGQLLAAGRLDNLASCYAGLRALLAVGEDLPERHLPVLVLFDHEECGSQSERGALSTLLPGVLERIVASTGGGTDPDRYRRALAATVVASADMAHARHPARPERHESEHPIDVGAGPVVKVNANLRYATDAIGAGHAVLACERAGVPLQWFVMRSDLPCGSTVGPMTAAATGATTFDVGAPLLSMHSCRELVHVGDQAQYAAALAAVLASG